MLNHMFLSENKDQNQRSHPNEGKVMLLHFQESLSYEDSCDSNDF